MAILITYIAKVSRGLGLFVLGVAHTTKRWSLNEGLLYKDKAAHGWWIQIDEEAQGD